jgi:hypothetical protein
VITIGPAEFTETLICELSVAFEDVFCFDAQLITGIIMAMATESRTTRKLRGAGMRIDEPPRASGDEVRLF